MGTIVKDGTIVYTHIDDIPRGAMEIRLPVPEGYVAEIISDGLIAIRPAESEDERIRKAIIELLKEVGRDDTGISENAKCMIAYLERHKYSPMPEDTVIFQKGVEEGRRLEREEQKPEWSEEDEICLQDALWCVKQASKIARGENDMGACWSAERWLNSLKNRGNFLKRNSNSPWKPSEEQMEALKCAVEDVAKFSKRGGRQVELENEPYYRALHSLYCNLEKLM